MPLPPFFEIVCTVDHRPNGTAPDFVLARYKELASADLAIERLEETYESCVFVIREVVS
jgi:hypothetical protein